MNFSLSITGTLFQVVPSYNRVVIAGHVTYPKGIHLVQPALDEAITEARDGREARELPQLECWRHAFRAIGINPKRMRPAPDALFQRVLRV